MSEKSRKKVYVCIAVILCLGIAAIILCLTSGICLKKDTADPLFSRGTVSIKSPDGDEWVPLTEHSIITEGCEIMTGEGSSLELSLPGENIVKIGESSHIRFSTLGSIEVTKIARSDIDILYGKMRAFVAPFRDNSSRFMIHSGNSSIGVRGTDFGVITSRETDSTEVLCFDGEVLVSPEDETIEWEPIVVSVNRELTIAADKPVGEPVLLDEDKRNAFLGDMALESLGETDSPTDEIPMEPTSEMDVSLHAVESGDTLWDLAVRYYGSGREYQILFDANRDVVDDENRIYPGQVLQIP